MKVKKMIKALVAVLLIACSLFSFVACSDEPAPNANPDQLKNQYETKRYYFRQGYEDSWKVKLECSDDPASETKLVPGHEEQGLALQLVPKDAPENSVSYNVFCNWNKGVGMVTSSADLAKKVMDAEDKLFFNELNFIDEIRDPYNQDADIVEKDYNEMPWCQVSFTYNDGDGDPCKGVWNLLADGENYYIVSYEGKEAEFDKYFADFEKMIEDFKKASWEKE